MFEVATWLKDNFPCMVFLPLRNSTYDQFCDSPPLDTVIKDLVFRIDPPLLEKVVQARLDYAVRNMDSDVNNFVYYLNNGIRVECNRSEVQAYLKCIIHSLFQDNSFKKIIVGLAGRNIRKGLEILLDFCKSGHITEDEIFLIRQSNGNHTLQHHLIAKVLLKGKRKFYSDEHSYIKNLFHSDQDDSLPDPFVRISILQWLKDNFRILGPDKSKGYHKLESLVKCLQYNGHSLNRIICEVRELINAGCIASKSDVEEITLNDLITITSSGFIHLDLLQDMNYLSIVAEDTLFRDTQVAKAISDNMLGHDLHGNQSKQTDIENCFSLLKYLNSYYENYFFSDNQVVSEEGKKKLINIKALIDTIERIAKSDQHYSQYKQLIEKYPVGTWTEGQIVKIKDYGLFIEFGISGKGFIHSSKFGRFTRENVYEYSEGDWVIVEISSYNHDHRRFDLALIDISK